MRNPFTGVWIFLAVSGFALQVARWHYKPQINCCAKLMKNEIIRNPAGLTLALAAV